MTTPREPGPAGTHTNVPGASVLRPGTTADIDAVAGIHRTAFFRAMPDMPVLHTPEDDVSFYREVVFPNNEVWVAESSKGITGFIAFQPSWVNHLYVHPDHQRCRVGSGLLALAQGRMPDLRLWTFQCNAAARRFYEQHGFRIERMTDGANNAERQPDILYRWTKEGQPRPR